MNEKDIVLAHLSDIHFYEFNSSSGQFDLNEDLRNELERDAEELVQRFDHVNGIVVTGDIAFSGITEEYNIAKQWLEGLRRILDSPGQNIWSIPGNHDVHRPTIEGSLNIPNMHNELRTVDTRRIDETLVRYLGHSDGDLLFEAIKNYNSFANPYGCVITRLRPFWLHDLELNDGSFLRLAGLNSTLVSDASDDQRSNLLVLGERQSLLLNRNGVTYLAMCHHPADWLRDEEAVTDNLIKRAAIQLFGHKHTFHHRKVTETGNESLIVSAGAVHPSRKEVDWQPRYNFISISVVENNNQRQLEVKVWPRIYTAEKRFAADFTTNGSDHRISHINIGAWNGKTLPERHSVHEVIIGTTSGTHMATVPQATHIVEEAIMENERLLVYRFFSLSYPQIVRIAVDLDLLRTEDRGANETDLLNRFYTRAKAANRLAELWQRVKESGSDDQLQGNPFL